MIDRNAGAPAPLIQALLSFMPSYWPDVGFASQACSRHLPCPLVLGIFLRLLFFAPSLGSCSGHLPCPLLSHNISLMLSSGESRARLYPLRHSRAVRHPLGCRVRQRRPAYSTPAWSRRGYSRRELSYRPVNQTRLELSYRAHVRPLLSSPLLSSPLLSSRLLRYVLKWCPLW
jgi:hypothetical protein